MTDSHAVCRRELVEEELTPGSREHLAGCMECSRFAERFEAALRAAPSLAAPPMPPGLTARVLERLRIERASAPLDAPGPWQRRIGARRVLPPPGRRRWIAAMAVAAAAVVLAVTLVPILEGRSAQAALLSASRATARRATAGVAVTGNVRGAPRGNAASGEVGRFAIRTSAEGEVAFARQLHLRGSTVVTGAGPGEKPEDEEFDVVVKGRKVYDVGVGGLQQRDDPLPPGLALGSPGSILAVLSAGASAEVRDLGETALNGERVRHYRFAVPSSVLRVPFASSSSSRWATDVWIGEADETLRALSAVGRGSAAGASAFRWAMSLGVRLSRFGVEVPRVEVASSRLTADGSPLLARAVTLARHEGDRALGRSVPVESVVADEGFWVGTSERNRVFVHVLARNESPPRIRAGARVSFTGVVRRNPDEVRSFGLSTAEGRQLLRRQGYHIEVAAGDLRSG